MLRGALAGVSADGARWLHRGLTSQDVVDTALMLCARDAVAVVVTALREQVRLLVDLVELHRRTPMVARTLTQHAVPTTFGLKAAGWLTGVLDSYDATSALVLPVQVGGAAGTMAATVELAGDLDDPIGAATALSLELATALGLTASTPWHTSRSSVTRLGDAAVGCTDAWGRIATDVVDPQPSRDRRAVGGRARRVVDHAPQGQPRPRHPRPPDRARQPRPRVDPARRGRRRRTTNARRAPGTPSGTPCARCCAGRWSPPGR